MGAKLKTINAEEAAYEGFRQLAKECELTNPELVAAMVQYFRVTKADPRHPTGLDLTTSLAKITAKLADLDKRTIGFIREQEKQYLKPILAEVQAQKAMSAPTGPSDTQVRELQKWLIRVLARGMQPEQLTPTFIAGAPEIGANKTPDDSALAKLKQALLGVLQIAFRPELLVPAMRPKLPGTSSTPPSYPTQPA
jgi:hypothetical protein